jgi:hypothetical protein
LGKHSFGRFAKNEFARLSGEEPETGDFEKAITFLNHLRPFTFLKVHIHLSHLTAPRRRPVADYMIGTFGYATCDAHVPAPTNQRLKV